MWNPQRPIVADIKTIKRELDKIPRNTVVRLGGMTDCFQPLEKIYKVTYQTIKALNMRGQEYLIVTKSALVADDEYIKILDKNLAHIQITITTLDDELCRTYEKASPPSERVKAVEKLQELGFDVAVRLSPFIPQYMDMNKFNAIKCDKVIVEFLRVNAWIKKWFDIDYSEYSLSSGGYWHLPLSRKKQLISRVKFKQISV